MTSEMLQSDFGVQELRDPLRHFMQCDEELEGVISAEGLSRSSTSTSELLTVLPQQHHSVENGLLELSFSHKWENVPDPLSISLHVDASPGCGGLAWPAGQILAAYLVSKGPEHFRDKNVLELGSGTGLVGLVIGAFGKTNVLITDQASPFTRDHEAKRFLESPATICESNRVKLIRGEPIPTGIPRPDILLAADCVYFEPAFPLLVQTLVDLSDSTTEIFFCYKKRRKADKRFFGMLKKKFTWKEVADDPNGHIYNREAITLMQLSKISKPYI